MTQQNTATGEASSAPTPGKALLRSWLNKNMKIVLSDGRVLVGIFLCTDKDSNVILGSCTETLCEDDSSDNEPRVLGLAMVPGKHIVTIHVDETSNEIV